tara:strand:- start:4119 stop:4949 length:831 start_codon:yes stop_codon:yes gene_type:complete
MGELAKNNQKNILAPTNFLKVVQTQLKVANMSEEQFSLGIRVTIAQITPFLKLKEEIELHHANDIKKMILSRFKHLSFEEIVKAFENERYGVYEKRTEHYQLFSAEYVSEVLTKYEKWKLVKRRQNNLDKKEIEAMSEEEVIKMTERALTRQLTYFYETRTIDKTRIYVYDIFDKAGLMPKDIEYKKSVHKDAIQLLKQEYQNRKAKTKEEHKNIKEFLATVNEKTISEEIKWKCKELALEDYLRKEIKGESDIERLKDLILKQLYCTRKVVVVNK